MKKLSIKVLISVMILAALGLIGIQLFWMNTFEKNRSVIFDSTVQSALNNVQRKLETREAERFNEQKVNVNTNDFKNVGKVDKSRDSISHANLMELRRKYVEGKAVLGVEIKDIDRDIVEILELESVKGVYVDSVHRLTPAFHAGLKKGDIITEINGNLVVSVFEFMEVLNKLKKGSQIDLTFERLNYDDKNWLSKCKAIDQLYYNIFDDSIRISYRLHIQDCENPSDYRGHQVIIDSTTKYNTTITDTSTKQELLSFNYNHEGVLKDKFFPKNSRLNKDSYMIYEKDHYIFSTVESLGKYKKYMSDDSIPNEIRIDQALAMEVINDKLEDDDRLIQYAIGFMNKKVNESNNKSLVERLSKFDLSKMIKEELEIQGIDKKVEWGIIEYSKEVLFSKNYKNFENLKTYSTPLFPNDIKRKPRYITVRFPDDNTTFASLCTWVFPLLAMLFLGIIIFCFAYTVNTVIKQKKLSELTTDFINNMTHELKTPVSTIKLASEMLLDENVPAESNVRFIKIIQDENQRLGSQIERVLQIAKIDKDKSKLRLEKLNVHEILEDVMQHSLLQIEQKNGKLAYEFNSSQPIIEADRVHLTNIFNNLLDNAIKYTPKLPKLKVSTEDTEDGIIISFKDNGIGMNKESQKKIFDKFYRVPTGNLHNVKGFGLGLSYVKLITEAHGGNVSVVSKPNQGSIFQLFLPKNTTEYNIS